MDDAVDESGASRSEPAAGTIPVRSIHQIDDRVHGRVRLAIMSLLSAHKRLSFLTLKAATETSDGNLAVHLQKLQGADLIEISRDFTGRQRCTHAMITPAGHEAYRNYRMVLQNWLKL